MMAVLPRPGPRGVDNPGLKHAEALGAAMARAGYRFGSDADVRAFLVKEGWEASLEQVEEFRRGYTVAWGK